MRLVAEAKGVALVLADNPPCAVRSDVHQLRRVFYNLIDNTVKYTAAGELCGWRADAMGMRSS